MSSCAPCPPQLNLSIHMSLYLGLLKNGKGRGHTYQVFRWWWQVGVLAKERAAALSNGYSFTRSL